MIAATAVGLGLARYQAALYPRSDNPLFPRWFEISLWVGFAWSLGLIPLRLMAPRPPWADLRRQPGLIMVVALISASIFTALPEVMAALIARDQIHLSPLINWLSAPDFFVPSIVAAWITLAVCGGWRVEAGWIDRLGRLLGSFWIVAWLYSQVLETFFR